MQRQGLVMEQQYFNILELKIGGKQKNNIYDLGTCTLPLGLRKHCLERINPIVGHRVLLYFLVPCFIKV